MLPGHGRRYQGLGAPARTGARRVRGDDSLRLVKQWNDPKRFTAQPLPGVSLAALKYLHLERHTLMHGHEPLDTDNTAPQFVGEKWLLRHNFAQAEGVANLDQVPEAGALITIGLPTRPHALRRGADGVMREPP